MKVFRLLTEVVGLTKARRSQHLHGYCMPGHCEARDLQVVVVQSLSYVQLFVTPWTAAYQAPLPSTISQSLLKFMLIESVMLSKHHPLLPPFPFAFDLSPNQCFSQ